MSGYAPASTRMQVSPGQAPAETEIRRTFWFDLTRVIAITAVVLIHTAAPVVEGKYDVTVGSAAWWVANLLDSASRWAVPVFVMLSGALLLDPGRGIRPRTLYLRRAHRIGLPLVFWTAFYLAFREVVHDEDLTVERAALDVLGGTPFLHLYFLYVMLGLAVLTPVLRLVTGFGTRRMVAGTALALLGVGMLDQAAVYAGAGDHNAVTRFLPYAGYYLAGWYLKDQLPAGRRLVATGGVFAAAVVVTAALARLFSHSDGFGWSSQYVYGYLSPPVVVMALTAYPLLHALGDRWERTTGNGDVRVRRLGELSFGVFLVHPAVLIPLRQVTGLPPDVPGTVAMMAAHVGVVLVVSYAVTAAAGRLPLLRRVF